MAIGLWVVLVWLPWVAANALAPPYHDGDPYWRLLVHDSVPLVGGIVSLVVALPFLRSVSYRRRDVFLLMVPGYGLYFSWLVCWRLSFLPFVDWHVRPDQWRQVMPIVFPDGTRIGRMVKTR